MVRMLLSSSRKPSSATSESVNMKTFGFFRTILYRERKSSFKSSYPYVLVRLRRKTSKPATYVASLVRDCFPEPPKPTKSALPLGKRITLWMRVRCSRASVKSTKSIALFSSLYSSRKLSSLALTFVTSPRSSYRRGSSASSPGSLRAKSPKKRGTASTSSSVSLKCWRISPGMISSYTRPWSISLIRRSPKTLWHSFRHRRTNWPFVLNLSTVDR